MATRQRSTFGGKSEREKQDLLNQIRKRDSEETAPIKANFDASDEPKKSGQAEPQTTVKRPRPFLEIARDHLMEHLPVYILSAICAGIGALWVFYAVLNREVGEHSVEIKQHDKKIEAANTDLSSINKSVSELKIGQLGFEKNLDHLSQKVDSTQEKAGAIKAFLNYKMKAKLE